jgi:diguanylate cyclase (GGDEF)-like protein
MSEATLNQGTILIVDDTPTNLAILVDYLAEQGFDIAVAMDGLSAIEQISETRPDLILLDVRMPGIDGFETCRRLKAQKETNHLPVIFMTALSDTEDKVKGFQVGAVDYVTKPIQQEEVLARVTAHLTLRRLQVSLEDNNARLQQEILERQRVENALRTANEQLERQALELKKQYEVVDKLAVTDDVSGFYNTRFLHQFLDQMFTNTNAAAQALSLVFFDLDGFKRVVDTHGHLLGAKILKEVAEVVNHYLDPADRIVRYGGDEYVVILPDQEREAALTKVERIKEGVAATAYLQEEHLNVRVTASFGLATFPQDARDKKELLAAADQCLFQSKASGKNTISVAGGDARAVRLRE